MRGLENFRSRHLLRSAPGLVFYNGPEDFVSEGLRVLNPFRQKTDLFTLGTISPLKSSHGTTAEPFLSKREQEGGECLF